MGWIMPLPFSGSFEGSLPPLAEPWPLHLPDQHPQSLSSLALSLTLSVRRLWPFCSAQVSQVPPGATVSSCAAEEGAEALPGGPQAWHTVPGPEAQWGQAGQQLPPSAAGPRAHAQARAATRRSLLLGLECAG